MRRSSRPTRLQLQHLFRRLAAARTGFTLVEAIIVIGILLVLASIVIPQYQDYVQNARNAKTSISDKAKNNDSSYSAILHSATQ